MQEYEIVFLFLSRADNYKRCQAARRSDFPLARYHRSWKVVWRLLPLYFFLKTDTL